MRGLDRVVAVSLLLLYSGSVLSDEEVSYDDLRDDNEVLRRAEVEKELELVDYQLDALRRSNDDIIRMSNGFKQSLPSLPPEEVLARSQQVLRQMGLHKLKAREETLLPHQLQRLAELRWQYRALNDPVSVYGQAFDLTDEQKARMDNLETELRSELIAKMRAFQSRAERELLEVLTPQQRSEWQRKMGERFEFETLSNRGLTMLRRLK